MVSDDLTVTLEPLGEVVGSEADWARCWASSRDQNASKFNIPGPRRAACTADASGWHVWSIQQWIETVPHGPMMWSATSWVGSLALRVAPHRAHSPAR